MDSAQVTKRKGIISAHIENPQLSCRKLGKLLNLPRSTVQRVIAKFKEEASVERKGGSGRKKGSVDKELESRVIEELKRKPNISIRDVADQVGTSHSTVHRMKTRAGLCSSTVQARKILKEKQEAQAVHINIQEEETSGPSSFNIKQEITIDESDLDHLNFPKLEPVQNTSEVIDRVEENCNSNISPSTSNKFHEERKTNDKDNRIEDGDLLNTVQGEVENGDKYVEYGMYIANRLRNANQSDSAIDIAKQEIEVILNELERGIFTISLH